MRQPAFAELRRQGARAGDSDPTGRSAPPVSETAGSEGAMAVVRGTVTAGSWSLSAQSSHAPRATPSFPILLLSLVLRLLGQVAASCLQG